MLLQSYSTFSLQDNKHSPVEKIFIKETFINNYKYNVAIKQHLVTLIHDEKPDLSAQTSIQHIITFKPLNKAGNLSA